MKKTILLLIAFAFIYLNADAQLVGKKMQVVSSQNMNITVNQMGNEISMPMTTETYVNYEIKNVTDKNVQMSGTLTRVKGSVTMMGNETKYDSDDPSSASANPQVDEALKDVKKEKTFAVEIGKTPDMTDLEKSKGIDVLAYSLFFPFDKSATEGSKLADSSKNENGSKSATEYSLTKLSATEATVTATTKATISSNVQRNGMDIKMNLQTTAVSSRVYDLSTGLLKTDTTDTNITGTQEITAMGMSMPITMKGTSTTTVQ